MSLSKSACLDYSTDKQDKLSTLVELLSYRAQNQPDQTAYTFLQDGETESGSLTYRELDQQARTIAASLQLVVSPGERALLLYPSGLEFIATFFGCLYAGVVAVPAYPPKRNQKMSRLQAIVADSQAKVALTTQEILTNIESRFAENPELIALRWLATDTIAREQAESWQEPALSEKTLAFLQYTSGSTGTPKGVMVSHGNLLHNERTIQKAFGHTDQTIFVGWLPLFHDMGLIGNVLQPMYLGIKCILMPPVAFLQKPLRWLQAISRYKATTSGGPNFAYDLCVQKTTPEQRASLDLSSWKVAFNGAEPVRWSTIEQFSATFESCGFKRDAFYPCYGMAETTLFVTGGVHTHPPVVYSVKGSALEQNQVVAATGKHEDTKEIVGCGQTWLDEKIVIVDPETFTQCQENQVGEIWVSSESVAQGYWRRREQTEQTFQAYLADTGEGPFLRTGDLGFCADGELCVTGRLKDVIIIRGSNHYPQDIELTVEQSHPALRPNCGAAFSVEVAGQEKLVIAQEVERSYLRKLNATEVIGAIRRAVTEQHELEVYAVLLLKTVSLPKTSSGKVQRSACRAGFLAGSLDVVADWSVNPQNKTQFPDLEAEVESLLQQVKNGKHPAGSQSSDSQKPEPNQQPSHSLEAIQAWLIARIAEQIGNAQEIDIQQPLAQYGLSSLTAVTISSELQEWLGRPLSPTLLYDYPTIAALAQHLALEPGVSSAGTPTQANAQTLGEAIAIIGMGCHFPGAKDPQSFWELLRDGVDAIKEVPPSRWDSSIFSEAQLGKMHTRWGGFLEQVDQFDPQFFGISPREAEFMDPQQRRLLEVSWEALENAGQMPDQLAGSRTGVFIGISSNDYSQLQFNHPTGADAYSGTGNAFSIAANRLSYLLDLRGPSWAVDTACSSSLVAVHQACQSLRQGECHLALAGGVNLILSPQLTITFSKAGMIAVDGRCKTFDAKADGYVRGEGSGVVVLKRLSDALKDGDNILAVIRGSAVTQDGRTNGLTAPNGLSQQAVVRQALENAGVAPGQISYVEAHGTGTSLGDPIEVNSLKEVLMEGRKPDQPCWIGSVKTNIGHLEAAAGIAGLLKVVLQLQHGEIPPHLHLKQLNPYISLEGTPLSIPTECQSWDAGTERRLAGVSAFSFGGTNCHAILEEAPRSTGESSHPKSFSQNLLSSRPLHLLTLSTKSEKALGELAKGYQAYLKSHTEVSLADVCFTANTGRRHFDHRLAVVAESTVQLREQLGAFAAGAPSSANAAERETAGLVSGQVTSKKRQKIAFLFTGQGSQYLGMGRQLYDSQPSFRKALERCDQLLRPYLDVPLLKILYPDTDSANPKSLSENPKLDETAYTQPALFALEYALVQLWQSWGIEPAAVMGHSVGEYVAACIAGVFSLEDGLKLIAQRGRLMQALPQEGEMVAVFADEGKVLPAIRPYAQEVSIAAINGPESVVISGQRECVQAVLEALEAEGVKTKKLNVSHAFHSPLMEPMLADFEQVAQEVTYSRPRISLISNVTGGLVTAEIATPDYWCRHVRQPVKFAAGMETLHRQGDEVFVEIGPKPTLLGMGRHCLPDGEVNGSAPLQWLPSLRPGREDWQQLLESLAQLYVSGVPVDWSGFDRDYGRCCLQLPTYPWQRKRYWIETTAQKHQPAQSLSLESVQTPILNLFNQEDIQQLAQQLKETGNFSPAQKELLPELLAVLVNQYQQQLSVGSTARQNAASQPTETSPSLNDQAPAPTHKREDILAAEPAKRRQLLETYFAQLLAKVMGVAATEVNWQQRFSELGLDSLIATELRKRMEDELEVIVPVEFFAELSLKQFLTQVLLLLEQQSDKKARSQANGTSNKTPANGNGAAAAPANSWLTRPKVNPQAQLRLFCFPYAGAGSSCFHSWTKALPPEIEICPLQLPGRETRLGEAPLKRLKPLIETLAPILVPYLDKPFAFFGHSMGALLGFELARELRRRNWPLPFKLLVCASRAPQLPDPSPPIHRLPEAKFIEELKRLEGIPQEVFDNQELMQLFLPTLRADFELSENYFYLNEKPLDCPIAAFGGLEDTKVSRDELAVWREQTESEFTLQMFSGNHFFLHTANHALMPAIAEQIHQLLIPRSCPKTDSNSLSEYLWNL